MIIEYIVDDLHTADISRADSIAAGRITTQNTDHTHTQQNIPGGTFIKLLVNITGITENRTVTAAQKQTLEDPN